jgi:hypothetical protein
VALRVVVAWLIPSIIFNTTFLMANHAHFGWSPPTNMPAITLPTSPADASADTTLSKLASVIGHIIIAVFSALVKLANVVGHFILFLVTLVVGAVHYIFIAFAFIATHFVAILVVVAILMVIPLVAALVIGVYRCLSAYLRDNRRLYPQRSNYHGTPRPFHQSQPSYPHTRNSYVHGQSPTRQTASTSTHAQAAYRRPSDPKPHSAHISKLLKSSRTHSHTRLSLSAYPHVPITVGRSKPNENNENINTAEELREHARRHHREIHDAHELTKSALFNVKTAAHIFKENNKVRM